ncbi:MAG TPA: hypothetical protein VM145_06605 [Sphingomicrobium sp.]|nr:hypothetical protein [Sphingomicrobium sp.]
MARSLGSLMLLLAMLLMPLGMSPASAGPVPHPAPAGMTMGHCPDQAPSHDKKAGFAECAMACAAALPAAQARASEVPPIEAEPLRLVAANRLHGLNPETATPPPRES